MKLLQFIALFSATVFCAAPIASCTHLASLGRVLDYSLTSTEATVKGQFRVQLIECVGNASSQTVTAIVAVTNVGTNSSAYIGGSLNGTMAIDSNGSTIKPYSSAGTYYELPSGVTLRVEIDRLQPVMPGTPMFQTLRVSIGSGNDNVADFRNVPITWMN